MDYSEWDLKWRGIDLFIKMQLLGLGPYPFEPEKTY